MSRSTTGATDVRARVLAVLGVVALYALTACTTVTSGEPAPPSGEPDTTSTKQTTSESEEESDYSLARLCELLTPEEARQLGASPEGEKGNSTSDGHDICTWDDETYLIVGYQQGPTSADVKDGPGITNTPTTVDGLPGVQSSEADPPGCQVLIDLPSGILFSVSAGPLSAGEGKYEPCELANDLAKIVIPRVKDQ